MVCDKVLGILEKHSIGIFKKVRVKQFSNFILNFIKVCRRWNKGTLEYIQKNTISEIHLMHLIQIEDSMCGVQSYIRLFCERPKKKQSCFRQSNSAGEIFFINNLSAQSNVYQNTNFLSSKNNKHKTKKTRIKKAIETNEERRISPEN